MFISVHICSMYILLRSIIYNILGEYERMLRICKRRIKRMGSESFVSFA